MRLDRKRLANWGFAATVIAVCLTVLSIYKDFQACVQCSVLERLERVRPWSEAFLKCSNIEQRIDYAASRNIREETGEVEGWTRISAANAE